MWVLRAAWFAGFAGLATLAFGVVAVVGGVVDRRRTWSARLMPLWSRALLGAAGVRVRVLGDDARGRAVVYASNHQSNLDILVLGVALPNHTLWLAKRELFAIPIFGAAMRAIGYIPVDRADPTASRASIGVAARALKGGASILMFPEGTRSPDGRLLPFKMGFAHLAADTGAPVVPLVVRGTGGLWPKGSLAVRSGEVSVTFLAPRAVDGAAAGGLRQQAEELRQEIGRACGAAG